VIGQEIQEPIDKVEFGHLPERYPTGIGRIRSSDGLCLTQRGDGEVDDHEVVLGRDPLDPPNNVVHDRVDAGLLGELSQDCFGHGFAQLHAATWKRPLAQARGCAPFDQQKVLSAPGDSPDTNLRPVRHELPSRRFTTMPRATRPNVSK
jgi:hypothetical protein